MPDQGNPNTDPGLQWLSGIPEEFRAEPSLGTHKIGQGEQGIAVPASVIKSFVHGQKLIGADRLPIPGANATDQDWGVVFDKLGRPKDPTGYAFKPPDGVPQGFPLSADLEAAFKTQAHAAGLNPKQASRLYDWYVKANVDEWNKGASEAQTAHKTAVEALQKEWGQTFDAKVQAARWVVQKFGGKEFGKFLDDSGLGNNPTLIRAFAQIADNFKEDIIREGNQPLGGGMTPDSAKTEWNKLQMDKDFMVALRTRDHLGHQGAMETYNRLFAAMSGGK